MRYIKSIVIIIVFSAALPLFFASCERKTERKTEPASKELHEDVSIVSLSQQQFNSIMLQLGNVEQKNLTGNLRASGFLKVPPQNKANINSPFGGTVQSILVQEGDVVRKGQTLATLTNPEFIKIQQEYLETQAQLTFANAELKRQKELSDNNVSAKKVYQQTELNFNALTVKYNSLRKQLSLLNINTESLNSDNILTAVNINSPINGNVSHIAINIGKTVPSTNEIMDVVDNSQLHLDLFIYEQDISKIKIGQLVDIMLTNLPGMRYTAIIFSIGSAFEGESKSIPVHATVTGNKSGLIEGMNVTANIALKNNTVPSVPESAIISFAGNDYIFIQVENPEGAEHKHAEGEIHNEDEEQKDRFSFKRIHVKRGMTDSGFTEITPLQEMNNDVKIVVNGSYYLISMMTNQGEHDH